MISNFNFLILKLNPVLSIVTTFFSIMKNIPSQILVLQLTLCCFHVCVCMCVCTFVQILNT